LSRRRVSHVCFDAPANDEAHLGLELPSPKKRKPNKKKKKNQKTKKRVLKGREENCRVCGQSKPMMSSSLKLEAKRSHTERLLRDEMESQSKLVKDPTRRQSLH
jgi:hypothetical protein